jgi:hypothetical protein
MAMINKNDGAGGVQFTMWATLLVSAIVFVVSSGSLGPSALLASQSDGGIVEDPRPVAKAMVLLSRQHGWTIASA